MLIDRLNIPEWVDSDEAALRVLKENEPEQYKMIMSRIRKSKLTGTDGISIERLFTWLDITETDDSIVITIPDSAVLIRSDLILEICLEYRNYKKCMIITGGLGIRKMIKINTRNQKVSSGSFGFITMAKGSIVVDIQSQEALMYVVESVADAVSMAPLISFCVKVSSGNINRDIAYALISMQKNGSLKVQADSRKTMALVQKEYRMADGESRRKLQSRIQRRI